MNKKVILVLSLICLLLSFINFQGYTLIKAKSNLTNDDFLDVIWVDKGCGSTYYEGETCIVYINTYTECIEMYPYSYVEIYWSTNGMYEKLIFKGAIPNNTTVTIGKYTIVRPVGVEKITAYIYSRPDYTGDCYIAECIFYSKEIPCQIDIWVNKNCGATYELGEYIEIYGRSNVEVDAIYTVMRPDGTWSYKIHLPANKTVVIAYGKLDSPSGQRTYKLCVLSTTTICDECSIYVKAGKGCFSGYVKDEKGNAIFDAEVKITSGPIKTTTRTDSNGFYKFCDLPAGTYSVIVQKDCLKSNELSGIKVEGGKETKDVNLILKETYGNVSLSPQTLNPRLKGGGSLIENFTISTDNCPAEISDITLEGPSWLEIINKPSMPYRLEGGRSLNLSLKVSPGISIYGEFPFKINVSVSKGSPSNLTLSGKIYVELLPGRIYGKIIDEDGNFVSNAKITLSGIINKEVYSNVYGDYEIKDITPGQYSLTVSKENYKNESKIGININPGDNKNYDFKLYYLEGKWTVAPDRIDLSLDAGESITKNIRIEVSEGKIKNLRITQINVPWITANPSIIDSLKFNESREITLNISPTRAVSGVFNIELVFNVEYGNPLERRVKLNLDIKPYVPPSNTSSNEDLDNDGKKDAVFSTSNVFVQINSSDKDTVISKIGLPEERKVVVEKIESSIQKEKSELELLEGPYIEILYDQYDFKVVKSESFYGDKYGLKKLRVSWIIISPTDENYSYVLGSFENLGQMQISFSSSSYFGATLMEAKISNPEKLLIFGNNEIDIKNPPSLKGYNFDKKEPISITYNNEVAFSFGFLSPWVTNPKGTFIKEDKIAYSVDTITLLPNESSFWQGFMSVINIKKEFYGKYKYTMSFKEKNAILQYWLIDKVKDIFKKSKNRILDIYNKFAKEITGFKDVEGSYGSNYISVLFEFGVIKGYPDKTVKAYEEVTRAQFVVQVCKFLRLEPFLPITSSFKDVENNDSNSWFYGYIEKAVSVGLVKGYPDGTFKPNGKVTKAEAVTVLTNALNILFNSPIQHFIDVPKNFWAYKNIEGAYQKNIIPKEEPIIVSNRFFPNNKAKRGELSAFLYWSAVYFSEK